MSNIAITGGATGTGVFSLVAPSTSTNRTITLPDSTGTMATAESTLAQFNATGAAPVYACRAWVNFNGTDTVAIRASGNVSSITDIGVGDYRINFQNSMPNLNFAFCITPASAAGGVNIVRELADMQTSYLNIRVGNATAQADLGYICASIFD